LVVWTVAFWVFLRDRWGLTGDDFLGVNANLSTAVYLLGLIGVLAVWGIVEALRHVRRRLATRPRDIANPS
jgi:hypothetical protein